MKSRYATVHRQTTEGTDILDITDDVTKEVERSGIRNGIVVVGVAGSTASVTTIEFEPGVVEDLRQAIERAAPEGIHYAHDARWGDGNGHAHVRAALLGPSASFGVVEGAPVLGTWQQIVLCDFDNRPRRREVYVHVVGD
ncbi:MAG TPA: secondary thiamine-phosphate synthase enzyme YjbQ [Polyangiaceae bacterium]|nr:secondary thiamine-phosphate synthase enzyme YjbQ [Polyangiaceae bacterium]